MKIVDLESLYFIHKSEGCLDSVSYVTMMNILLSNDDASVALLQDIAISSDSILCVGRALGRLMTPNTPSSALLYVTKQMRYRYLVTSIESYLLEFTNNPSYDDLEYLCDSGSTVEIGQKASQMLKSEYYEKVEFFLHSLNKGN